MFWGKPEGADTSFPRSLAGQRCSRKRALGIPVVSPGLPTRDSRILKVLAEGPRASRMTKALVEVDEDSGPIWWGLRTGGSSSGGCRALRKPEGWALAMQRLEIGASFFKTPGLLLAGPRLTTSINARGKGGRTPLMAAVDSCSVGVGQGDGEGGGSGPGDRG